MTFSKNLPQEVIRRAKMILLSSAGYSNAAIARKLDSSSCLVGEWRKRFLAQGLSAVYGGDRTGAPRTIPEEKIALLLQRIAAAKQTGERWTCRSLAEEARLSKSSVQRVLRSRGIDGPRASGRGRPLAFIPKGGVVDIAGVYISKHTRMLALGSSKDNEDRLWEPGQANYSPGAGFVEGFISFLPGPSVRICDMIGLLPSAVAGSSGAPQIDAERFLTLMKESMPSEMNLHVLVNSTMPHRLPPPLRIGDPGPLLKLHRIPTFSEWLRELREWYDLVSQRNSRPGSFIRTPRLVSCIKRAVDGLESNYSSFFWLATGNSLGEKFILLRSRKDIFPA